MLSTINVINAINAINAIKNYIPEIDRDSYEDRRLSIIVLYRMDRRLVMRPILLSYGDESVFMPRNILKHKSYNVYSARNIDRVKRDERNAEQAERQTRLLNQKERTDTRRRRIRQGPASGGQRSKPTDPVDDKVDKVDKVSANGNTHQEELESGVPLYTGSKVPWFAVNRSTQGTTTQLDHNDKNKAQLDPLAQMNKYIAQQKEYEQSSHKKKQSRATRATRTAKQKSKSMST